MHNESCDKQCTTCDLMRKKRWFDVCVLFFGVFCRHRVSYSRLELTHTHIWHIEYKTQTKHAIRTQPSNISIHSQRHYLLITFINMRSTIFSEHTASSSQMPQFQWIFTVFLLQVDFQHRWTDFFFHFASFCFVLLLLQPLFKYKCIHAKTVVLAEEMFRFFSMLFSVEVTTTIVRRASKRQI